MALSMKGYIPMCTPKKGKPWFAPLHLETDARSCRERFAQSCYGRECFWPGDWEALKKEGWRIVRVNVTTENSGALA